ncbi:Protein of unknown function [Evansella caseinilytica]|uniref:Uncharacterized protein n=1 Tax=Evansella caseinilytica TaxID=1503961 RepID=A0A1H3PR93_9BACI|nr:YisL family protein [Evansella caseinilytica]SDZ03481.1 Protein of unknown function [Evansella caseinilytica]
MAGLYAPFLHTHASLWAITIILFFVTVFLLRSGKEKAGKIVQMTLRLFFVLVLVTGVMLIIINDFSLYLDRFHWQSYVKGILAFWLIFIMEMIPACIKKGQQASKKLTAFWLQFIVVFALVLYFGYFVIG